MADHNHAPAHGDDGMDYAEHEKTYARFTTLVKYGSVAVVVLLILMAVFLR
ncbi:MAG: aa3-type cytochrome c oxidase subunit IV [Beijerinckiaceae bacterium]|nr:aa3-type cytochrome c oxidase subunit IV [Beijerinckiaceae bacterium]